MTKTPDSKPRGQCPSCDAELGSEPKLLSERRRCVRCGLPLDVTVGEQATLVEEPVLAELCEQPREYRMATGYLAFEAACLVIMFGNVLIESCVPMVSELSEENQLRFMLFLAYPLALLGFLSVPAMICTAIGSIIRRGKPSFVCLVYFVALAVYWLAY